MANAQESINQPQGPLFTIQRIYVKDLSFESPNSPKLFLEEWQPELNMDLDTSSSELDNLTREVVLKVTVTVKLKEQVAFLAEVKQAGIFSVQGFDDEQLRHLVGSFCPNILYPYAREAITDLVTRGGYPQLYLSPINFDMLFEQHEQRRTADEGTLQ